MMMTTSELMMIVNKLSLENVSMSIDEISDLSCIVYRNDVFDYANTKINSRHIDIELSYGEYYELHEGTPLFQYICSLCNLPLKQESQEIVIYQKEWNK